MKNSCGCSEAGCGQCEAQGEGACGHCCGESCQCSCHGDQSCECGQGCQCECHSSESCQCACHGGEVEEGDRMHLLKKAFKKMLVERLKAKLEKKYGKKMDKLADEVMDSFDKWMKMKKDMMEIGDFDLEEKMMEVIKG